MSTIIRDAVIRLKIEQTKASLESRGTDTIKRGYQEQTKAAGEARKANAENMGAVKESAAVHEDFGRRSFQSMAHAGHGIMQLTRGIALMSASGEEDTRKVLESLIKIEAAVAMAKGMANLAKFASMLHPVGRAVTAVTLAVGAGAVAWNRYTAGVAEAAKAAREARDALDRLDSAATRRIGQYESSERAARYRYGQDRIEDASSPEERSARIAKQRNAAEREASKADVEWSKIERTMAKGRGVGFGETTPEQKALLDQYGGYVGLKAAVASQAQAKQDAIERQKELARQQKEIELQQLASRHAYEMEELGGPVRFRSGVDPTYTNTRNRIEANQGQEVQQLLATFQTLFDGLTALAEKNAVYVRELESKLNQAASANGH